MSAAELEYARRRLEFWRAGRIVRGLTGPPPGWPHLGADLTALAGETATSLHRRLPEPPGWLRTVTEAWRKFPVQRPAVPAAGPSDGHPGRLSADSMLADACLLDWVRPLLTWAQEQLRPMLEKLVNEPARLTAAHPLLIPDTDHILGMVKRVLLLELHVQRVQDRLHGATTQERFASFTAGLTDPQAALDLLAAYPVLAREVVAHVRTWIRVRAELAQRLVDDAAVLHETFGAPAEGLTAVREIRFGAGDTHRGGRAVAVVGYENDVRVVYKPRSLAVEQHVNQLIGWINERDPRHTLRAVPVIDRGSYGWARYVRTAPCPDRDALTRFSWRQGAHLALFHALRGYDLHAWNVIAEGEHPAYIDLEALFYAASTADPPEPEPGSAADHLLRESVLTVQILPRRIEEAGPDRTPQFGVCGLAGGAEPGDVAVYPVPSYTDEGTDQMRLTHRPRAAVPTTNRPRLAGLPGPAPVVAEAVLNGFEEIYRLLLTHRNELLHPDGPVASFATDEVRVVLRNTRFYVALLDRLWHPDLLRDSFDRELFLQRLASGHQGYAGRAALVESELRQIERGDVPVFHARPGCTALYDPDGLVVPDFLPAGGGLAAVFRRLAGFSEKDLRRQLWFVRASLCTLLPTLSGKPATTGGPADVDEPAARAQPAALAELSTQAVADTGSGRGGSDLLVAAARRIGDRLIDTALRDRTDGTVEWLSLHPIGRRRWKVSTTPLGCCHGVTGIALFLAELAAFTDDLRYRTLAEETVAGLVGPGRMPPLADLRAMSIGAYEDLGAVLNLLVRLAALWSAPSLLDEADHLVAAMAQNLPEQPRADVVSGAAGVALTGVRLLGARPTAGAAQLVRDAVASVSATVDRYAVTGENLPPGLGSGAPGWAYAVARSGDVIGVTEAARLAGRILDLPWAEGDTSAGTGGSGWLDGTLGSGLALAGMAGLPLLAPRRPALLTELRCSLDVVRSKLFDGGRPGPSDDCLGRGGLGVVELLHEAGLAGANDELVDEAVRLAHVVADRVIREGPVTGAPAGVWTPGLLHGGAGIGLGLLRAAEPARIPSVLRW
ncbi:type 2 lanthipeptide synthetase LanM family protein [Micromonospora sp. NPDC093277]|uniref:type 2 lanthipeptide synthetase LanM family protein n=1 Tax=Micromonospora sp. NPDC093277 TaxID=3364291 RepID=UPI0037F40A7B